MLGTRVQLNCDGLDAAHGLVALAAARVMHHGRFVVIKKGRIIVVESADRCAGLAGNFQSKVMFENITMCYLILVES